MDMLEFKQESFHSRIVLPTASLPVDRPIEIRTDPITGRTCRITFSRGEEREPGAETLPAPPPFASDRRSALFASADRDPHPAVSGRLCPEGRMLRGTRPLSNLFPYGRYSAVSLSTTATSWTSARLPSPYTDSFLNCRDYLRRVLAHDPAAVFMAITQNHLPSAGGSLLHPHLQVQADRTPANYQRFLRPAPAVSTAIRHRACSAITWPWKADGRRCIGATGPWQWLAAFAPRASLKSGGSCRGSPPAPNYGRSLAGPGARGAQRSQSTAALAATATTSGCSCWKTARRPGAAGGPHRAQ